MMRKANKGNHYRVALNTMNLYYNFGVKLEHQELAGRLLCLAMCCKQEMEAVQLIKLYHTWLEHPPDSGLVYAVMSHFLDEQQFLVVREIAKAVREDWRMPLEPPLYSLAIEAMLRLDPDSKPLEEALSIYRDAGSIGVRLPVAVHLRLLEECLRAHEAHDDSSGDARCLRSALSVADAMARDGHVRAGAGSATLCTIAWLFWHIERLPAALRTEVLEAGDAWGIRDFLGCDWRLVLRASTEVFGSRGGLAFGLPRGLFASLEVSDDAEAARLLEASRRAFGRFYPEAADAC